MEVDYSWMSAGVSLWIEQLEIEEEGDAFLKGKLVSFSSATEEAIVEDLLTGK